MNEASKDILVVLLSPQIEDLTRKLEFDIEIGGVGVNCGYGLLVVRDGVVKEDTSAEILMEKKCGRGRLLYFPS